MYRYEFWVWQNLCWFLISLTQGMSMADDQWSQVALWVTSFRVLSNTSTKKKETGVRSGQSEYRFIKEKLEKLLRGLEWDLRDEHRHVVLYVDVCESYDWNWMLR